MANVPANEYADRGKMLSKPGYIPFTKMGDWQIKLAILDDHARKLADWSGDSTYRRAADMLTDAYNNGTYRMTGVRSQAEAWAHNVIQQVMPPSGIGALINNQGPDVRTNRAFVKRYLNLLTQAGYTEYVQRASSAAGYTSTYWYDRVRKDNRIGSFDREKMVAFWNETLEKYRTLVEVEKIINTTLPDASHHVVYYALGTDKALPTRVDVKRILHDTGVSAISQLADVDVSTAKLWVGASIKNKNMAGGVGNVDPFETSFLLAPDPEAALAAYRGGVQQPAVGLVVTTAVVLAVISLLAAAVAAAQAMYTESQKTKQLALTSVRGFGTPGFSAEKGDWPAGTPTPPGGNSGGNFLENPIVLAAGAGFVLYNLLSE